MGGAILTIFDCWEANYDETVACSGFGSTEALGSNLTAAESHLPHNQNDLDTSAIAQAVAEAHRSNWSEALTYTCYSDSSTKGFPVNRMKEYINKTVMAGPPADGRLYTIQALWQET